MAKMIKSIVKHENEKTTVVVHADADPGGCYDTLCGMDLNDSSVGHYSEPAKVTDKINCSLCANIFKECKKFNDSDFKI